MIDEVKKIKLDELNSQKAEYEKEEATMWQNKKRMCSELGRLEEEKRKGTTAISKKFNFIEKYFTLRKEYKEYKAQEKRQGELPQSIDEMQERIENEEQRVNKELEKSGLKAKLEEIKHRISETQKAKTLREMNMTPMQAMGLLESKGIMPVLTEADKVQSEIPRDYSSKSSLMCVHKTRYVPVSNSIKTPKDSNVMLNRSITINGKNYEYSYQFERNTIHFAMNGEVSANNGGTWDDCKYAVLMPFEDIPNSKIGYARPEDTFTKGSVDLSPNSWILCPKDEAENVKNLNPNVHVLGYEGESVQAYASPFLTQLGYRGEGVGANYWSDEKSNHDFIELMKKYDIAYVPHFASHFKKDEEMLNRINHAIELAKVLRDNNLITTPEESQDILKQLETQYDGFECIGGLCIYRCPVESEPDSIVGHR